MKLGTMIIRPSRPADTPALIEIWITAVDARHHFLSRQHRSEIEAQVRAYLPEAPLLVACDADDRPLGFLHLEDGHIHALFVHAARHGMGIGRELLEHARSRSRVLSVDVNEQNQGARAFYAREGFLVTGRSPSDDAGRPYPLLHLQKSAG